MHIRHLFRSLSRRELEIGLYALVIVVAAAVICMLLQASGGAWLELWNLICAVLKPLIYGAILGYIFSPIVARIAQALGRYPGLADNARKRRTIAVVITVCLVAAVLLGLIAGFALMLTSGMTDADWSSLASILKEATSDIMGFVRKVQEQLASLGLISEENQDKVVSALVDIKDAASTVIFSIIFTIYNLLDEDRLFAYAQRFARNVLGEYSIDGGQLLADFDRVFSGYFRGQAIDALIVAVLSAIALSLVRVPYAPLVGLVTGLCNLIPYLGGPAGFASIALVCFAEDAWGTMIAGFVVMAIVMFVDGNIINPKLLSSNIEVHPLLVVAALIAGGSVGGIAGMLVAVPIAAWLKIQLDRWMDRNEQSKRSLVTKVADSFAIDEQDGEDVVSSS